MDIKFSVIVNNASWNIIFTDDKIKLLDKKTGKTDKACILYGICTVYIDNSISTENKFHALKHEISHIYIYETQCELKELYSEEFIAEFIAIYAEEILKLSFYVLEQYALTSAILV